MKIQCPCCGNHLSISTMVTKATKKIDIERIADIVAESTGIKVKTMKAKSRYRDHVKARMQVMWLAKKYSRISLKEIGIFLGGRDHTTIIHGIRTINDLMYAYEEMRDEIQLLSGLCEDAISVEAIRPIGYLKAI